MIVKVPEKMPAQPMPAIARPRINATDEGAEPQIVEPISKIKMEAR